ncbi:MAG: hypothetical protein EPN50_00030 [Chloroflexota bacterium]|nr:MAG: hypothetical protein EPN50_00030 [Chloroflexota bacterium]
MARPHAVQPIEPGIAAPVTPSRPATTLGRVVSEDPRARLWRDASVALVLIAGLALAGSAGLLPDLLGRRPTGGPARSVVPLASASVGSGPTLPGASPSLPFTGRSTPTPGPSATSGGQGTSSSPPARSPASPTPPR